MPDGLKRAAVWLGLVSDQRYASDEVSQEITQMVDASGATSTREIAGGREARELTGEVTAPREARALEPVARRPHGVTQLEARRPSATGPVLAVAPDREESMAESDINRIVTVQPRTYNEARTIGEHFRDGVPVIMNLSLMEDVDAKRLVDFSSGLIFGLRGTIERVTSKVFLLSPRNVTVTAEDKERIAGGFFNQS